MTPFAFVAVWLAAQLVIPSASSVIPSVARNLQVQSQTRRAAPDTVRGLYVNRWAAISNRMWALIELAKTTEVNALVIDVKDDRGLVLYRSSVPLAKKISADTNRPMTARRMKAVLDSMKLYNIHAI